MATDCCLSELKDPSSIPGLVASFIIDKTSDSGISIAKIVGKAIIAAYGLEWEEVSDSYERFGGFKKKPGVETHQVWTNRDLDKVFYTYCHHEFTESMFMFLLNCGGRA